MDGIDTLFDCCADGDVDALRLAMQKPKLRVNVRYSGRTAFHIACEKGYTEVVSILLEDGRANPNQGDFRDCSPLFVASENGHTEVVRLLLEDGRADVNQVDRENCSPLFIACETGYTEVVRLLLADKRTSIDGSPEAHMGPLHVACRKKRAVIVSLLLGDLRTNVNLRAECGQTVLHLACEVKATKIVSLLLADPRVKVNQGFGRNTPFFAACETGAVSIIKLMLENKKVDINRPDVQRCTPLWSLAQNGHHGIITLLMASGRKIDTQIKCKEYRWGSKTAAEIARLESTRRPGFYSEHDTNALRGVKNGLAIAKLIEAYELNPEAICLKLRKKLGLVALDAGALYALVIFICDGLLTVKKGTLKKLSRFFAISKRLPMEVQMMLCNRVFGSMKDSILSKISEPAFKELGRSFSE